MTFYEFFEEYLEDEFRGSGMSVWDLSLSEYNSLKEKAWKIYKKENKEV